MAFLHDVGEKEEVLEIVKKYKEEYKRELSKEAENPCPTCNNSNVYRTQTKFGQGDWCPDCKMPLREMRGLA
jgi:transcription initiation factor IIE alpha subunit